MKLKNILWNLKKHYLNAVKIIELVLGYIYQYYEKEKNKYCFLFKKLCEKSFTQNWYKKGNKMISQMHMSGEWEINTAQTWAKVQEWWWISKNLSHSTVNLTSCGTPYYH